MKTALGSLDPLGDDLADSSADPAPSLPAMDSPASATSAASAAQPGTGASVGSVAARTTGGLVINIGYDPSVMSLATTDPALYVGYTSAVQAAVAFFESKITNPITINIEFGWGEVNDQPVQTGGRSFTKLNGIPYAQLYTALQEADATSVVQRAAVAALPANDPSAGGLWLVPQIQQQALGLLPANAGSTAWVGLGNASQWSWSQSAIASGTSDAVGVLEHEMSEVMGRLDFSGTNGTQSNVFTPFDLFRYTAADGLATDAPGSAAGARDEPFVAGYNPNAFSYFSYDGSTVTLPFDTPSQATEGFDIGDWNAVPGDAFDGAIGPGANTVSATDLQAMNVLGYGLVPAGAAATLTPVVLHGPAGQYIIATNNGSLYVQDTVAGRDGTQTLAGINELVFTNGVGLFDPTGAAEDVARLYHAALDRAPDASGLATWAAQIDTASVPLVAVADGFATSPEFIHDYGQLSDAAFVNQLYQNVLGRPADAAGSQFWTGLLDSGTSRGAVLDGFAESPENKANTISTAGDENNAEAYRLYQAALDRPADASGLAFWSSALANGATPDQVAQGFIASAEFQQHYGALSAADFVSTLYENVLHRPADASGLQAWTGALQEGTSEASVLAGFADSLENRVQTAAATHANWVLIPA